MITNIFGLSLTQPSLPKSLLMQLRVQAVILVALAIGTMVPGHAAAQNKVVVQSTTSTQNSGFYRHVAPAFTADTGIAVRVIAVGTGQALKNARNCDGDLLITHAREAEMDFVARGYGALRRELIRGDRKRARARVQCQLQRQHLRQGQVLATPANTSSTARTLCSCTRARRVTWIYCVSS